MTKTVTYVEAAEDGVTDNNVIINIVDGKFTYTDASEELDSLVKEVYSEDSYEFKSKTWKNHGEVEFIVDAETGLATHDGPTGPGSINGEDGNGTTPTPGTSGDNSGNNSA